MKLHTLEQTREHTLDKTAVIGVHIRQNYCNCSTHYLDKTTLIEAHIRQNYCN